MFVFLIFTSWTISLERINQFVFYQGSTRILIKILKKCLFQWNASCVQAISNIFKRRKVKGGFFLLCRMHGIGSERQFRKVLIDYSTTFTCISTYIHLNKKTCSIWIQKFGLLFIDKSKIADMIFILLLIIFATYLKNKI